jgi:hypothetical protein
MPSPRDPALENERTVQCASRVIRGSVRGADGPSLMGARRSAHVAQHASLIAGATKHAQVARGAWAPARERPNVIDLERVM